MYKYVRKYLGYALLASLFMVGEVLVDLWQPRLMETIVDDGILGLNNNSIPDTALVGATGLRMLLIVLCGGAFGVLSGVFTNICAQNCGNDMRKDLFRRIMHFSFEQTDQFTTGSLITRTTSDVTQVQNMISQIIRGMVRCGMFFVAGTIALVSLDVDFGRVLVVALPIVLLEIAFIVWKTTPLFTKLQDRLDGMNSIIQENVAGARVVKAFVQEEREEARFGKANNDLAAVQLKVLNMMAWMRPFMNIVLNLATVVLIRIGAAQVATGAAAPGTVMAGVTYLSQILNGMMMLANIFQTISRGKASMDRLQQVLNCEPVIRDGVGEVKTAAPGTIEFTHVSFAYPGRKEQVLEDINLTIHPGETLAVIGATGSGKSSLVNLIPRFYDVTAGRILVDGADVRDWKLENLRSAVTMVMQKSELFSTTIRDNIMMGRQDATEAEMKLAAQSAQAEPFILQQPQGYDTPVAEQGMSLSGGQKQRIAIARALLRGGEILILDDSTSALDLKTEATLHAALDQYYHTMTRIIIAQRIATVMHADRIAVIDNGHLVACDTHETLMRTCQVYQDIYESQLGKRSEL